MEPNKKLLDREASIAVAQALDEQLRVVESLVDYGTNLIVRVMSYSAEGGVRDLIPVCVLGKQVVAMLDGASVLLRSGCAPAAVPVYRSLYEAELQLTWILKEDTEERARTFFAAHLLKELRRCESERDGSAYRSQASKQFEKMRWRTDAQIDEQIAEIEAVLSRAEFVAIREELKAAKNRYWASRLGCSSLEQMARKVNRWVEYEVLYRLLSSMAHASNPKVHIRKGKGTDIEVLNIRDPDGGVDMLQIGAYWSIRCFRQLLGHYRPEEAPAFAKRYLEKWRQAWQGSSMPPPDTEPNPEAPSES